jgi:hypothetical protein
MPVALQFHCFRVVLGSFIDTSSPGKVEPTKPQMFKHIIIGDLKSPYELSF